MVRRPVRSSLRLALTGAAAAVVLSGCSVGGGGASDEALENARAEGARQARNEERVREQAKANRELQRQVDRLERRSGGSSESSSSSGTRPASSSGGSSSGGGGLSKSCGSGITTSSVTSCSFAGNVATAYYASGESSSIDVYSPVTGRDYTMSCSGSGPVSCSGGNGALVNFP